MDPKKHPQLDPKLKEIYDRVMGTPIQKASLENPSAQVKTQESSPKAAQKPRLFQQNTSSQAFVDKSSSPSRKPLGVIFFLLGILFFIAYTLFWLRYFNVELPFPLPF